MHTLHYSAYIPLHSITLRYVALRCIHCVTWRYTRSHQLHYVIVTLRYVALHDMTLRSHYVILRYVARITYLIIHRYRKCKRFMVKSMHLPTGHAVLHFRMRNCCHSAFEQPTNNRREVSHVQSMVFLCATCCYITKSDCYEYITKIYHNIPCYVILLYYQMHPNAEKTILRSRLDCGPTAGNRRQKDWRGLS